MRHVAVSAVHEPETPGRWFMLNNTFYGFENRRVVGLFWSEEQSRFRFRVQCCCLGRQCTDLKMRQSMYLELSKLCSMSVLVAP